MDIQETKFALEAILFATERPLGVEELKQAFDEEPSHSTIEQALELLKQDYEIQNRGFKLYLIAGGYQILTDPRFSMMVKRFYQARERKRLTQATLETLSIVAYKQPVTRAEIEFVRGVNVDNALKSLMDRGLIKMVGRKEVPGRPMLFGTTQDFLDHFGLGSVKELPALTEFTEKDIEPHLLPPEMKQEQEFSSIESPEQMARDVEMAKEESGEQKPIGCDYSPENDV